MSGMCFWTNAIGCFDDSCAPEAVAGFIALSTGTYADGSYLQTPYSSVNLYNSGSSNPCDITAAALNTYINGSITLTDLVITATHTTNSTPVTSIPDTSSFFPASFFSSACSGTGYTLPLQTTTAYPIQYSISRFGMGLSLPIVSGQGPDFGPTTATITEDSQNELYISMSKLLTAMGLSSDISNFDTSLMNAFLRVVCNGKVFFLFSDLA